MKKQFNVFLDEKLIMQFRRAVADKHGVVIKGCLGFEVDRAIRSHIKILEKEAKKRVETTNQ